MKISRIVYILLALVAFSRCGKDTESAPPAPQRFSYIGLVINGQSGATEVKGVPVEPTLEFTFSAPIKLESVNSAIALKEGTSANVPFTASHGANNRIIRVQPVDPLKPFTRYTVGISTALTSESDATLNTAVNASFITTLDSTDKFERISDDELLTLVQRQTFRYFWDFAHPVSGLIRERNTSGDLVTMGGSGFGIMSIVTGISRDFITRAQGLERIQKIVDFLQTNGERFHGAFPHWMNGITGKTIAFSARDDGADLVETALLMQGLLTARQFFTNADPAETSLRNKITQLYNEVEWDWFRKGDENVLYWHWSPNFGWEMNHKIQGWNEALIVYVLAAASPTHPIPKAVYDEGWARSGAMINGNSYYGVNLPLGPTQGGPLFFAHYSFLGLNPNGLRDAYADYWQQNVAHTQINYNYAVANPKAHAGYSSAVWGLTASDNNLSGYSAHSPDNDLGVISPTAALSSMPYTPQLSMNALRFFYYKLGDKIWKEYGFVDAFNLNTPWFADSFLAIDQGPIIIMIENHRSGLLWDLFMAAPEIKSGLQKLGFQSPHI